ncbi:hypothetical protein DVH24_000387 [Malus domestica]|uniref:Uncharacterized protein n=1 Tax=Malus domestica TaxID=3750 RepID=A0A498IZS7_MALDO|nr:hypothetical protein DVH24_000387 [Malus domestica]
MDQKKRKREIRFPSCVHMASCHWTTNEGKRCWCTYIYLYILDCWFSSYRGKIAERKQGASSHFRI